jgi:hypothetical protein
MKAMGGVYRREVGKSSEQRGCYNTVNIIKGRSVEQQSKTKTKFFSATKHNFLKSHTVEMTTAN